MFNTSQNSMCRPCVGEASIERPCASLVASEGIVLSQSYFDAWSDPSLALIPQLQQIKLEMDGTCVRMEMGLQ